MSQILRNSIVTPDGTELVSRYGHHYNCHMDANGSEYCVDGGNNYLRRTYSQAALDYTENSVHSDEPHDTLREKVEWGRQVNGDHEWIKIKDLQDDHLIAIYSGEYAKDQFLKVMYDEIAWRGL